MTDILDAYDDTNKAFLQVFMARSVMTFETARPILAAIFSVHERRRIDPEDVTVDDLNSYISAANSALSPLDLEIRSTFHQDSRERFYALVNTTSDSLSQLATTFSAEEIAYVKRLLDAMFDGQNNRGRREAMCISGMEAVQLARPGARRDTQNGNTGGNVQGLTGGEAENMLSRLSQERWLERSAKGFYSLTPRALLELKGWLVDTYNDPVDEDDVDSPLPKIKFCHACKEIITTGQRCSRLTCPCRLHDICTRDFFRVHRSQTCPLCKTEWDGKSYVGEKAITTSESYLKGKRKSTNRPRNENSEVQDSHDTDVQT